MAKVIRIGGLLLLVVLGIAASQIAGAAEATGEYLKYQEPQPATSSWLATTGYVFSLLLTFLVVLGLAYLTARFLGQRLTGGRVVGSGRICAMLSLGPKCAVYVVEIAGKYMVLGVTEQSITLLDEITSLPAIEQLKASQSSIRPPENFSNVFQRQMDLLRHMQKKPGFTFRSKISGLDDNEQDPDTGKR